MRGGFSNFSSSSGGGIQTQKFSQSFRRMRKVSRKKQFEEPFERVKRPENWQATMTEHISLIEAVKMLL